MHGLVNWTDDIYLLDSDGLTQLRVINVYNGGMLVVPSDLKTKVNKKLLADKLVRVVHDMELRLVLTDLGRSVLKAMVV